MLGLLRRLGVREVEPDCVSFRFHFLQKPMLQSDSLGIPDLDSKADFCALTPQP